jgi:hypothetical protein
MYEMKRNPIEKADYMDPSVIFYKPSPIVAEEKSMAAIALGALAIAGKLAACACAATSLRAFEKLDD